MDKTFDFDLCYDKLYKQVADQIQQLIVSRALRPGDRLPGERELAEQLDVSRSVVREAIRLLSVRGLVEVKAGCGTYVRQLGPEDVAAPIELLLKLQHCPDFFNNLYEVRHMIEVEIAGLAAERAAEDDHAALETALEEMAAHTGDPAQFTRHELAFHTALAAATGNDLLTGLLGAVSDFWAKTGPLAYQAPNATQASLAHHRDILKWIKARKPEKARQAMRKSICALQSLVEAVRRQDSPPGEVIP